MDFRIAMSQGRAIETVHSGFRLYGATLTFASRF